MPSVSRSQQRLMGWVHACQKYGKCGKSRKIKKIARKIDPEDADEFASTKHKGLPEKKDEWNLGFFEWVKVRGLPH